MAIAYHYRLEARREARFHVQVQVTRIEPVSHTPAEVPIKARVVRVFRSDSTLRVGDEVMFSMRAYRQDDYVPPGPPFMIYEKLMRGNYMEVYLNGDPPQCRVPWDECVILDRPTRLARFRTSRLGELFSALLLRASR